MKLLVHMKPRLLMRPGLTKLLLVMKLSFIFILAACLSAHATGYGQKISVSLENASVRQLFDAIRAQSDYQFLYTDKVISRSKPVSIDMKNATIEQVLASCFRNQPLVYNIVDRTIVIKFKKNADNNGKVEPTKVASPVIPISGRITNEKGEAISGVSIRIRNANIGTATDNDGSFQLSVPDENAVIEFSSVGYVSQSMTIGSRTSFNIILILEDKNLTDVVVVGYGTQKKADVTSAVVSVKKENFVSGNVRDAGQLLQGKVAGLTIGTPSGDPTATSQILLRGTATLNTSVQPLILIDGIPGDLYSVAPEDIESIDVLKDGSAAAIYGTRGTNGVVLITTRKPNGNIEPTIDYSGSVSTQSFVNLPDMLNAAQYKEKIPLQDLGSNTDWMKEVSRSLPLSHGHNISLRGGNAKTNYLATLGYRQFEGVFLKSNNRLINGRIDINHNMFNNKLKLNFNILNTDIRYNSLGNGNSFNTTIFRQALGRNPTAPVKNADGTWAEQTAIANFENPLALLNESYGQNQSQSTRLAGSATWLPVAGLQLKALVSRTKFNSTYGYAETKNNISTTRDGLQGYALKRDAQTIDQLMELTAQYNKVVNDHNFTVLGGYSYQDNVTDGASLSNNHFPAGNFSYIDNIGIGSGLGSGTALMSSFKYRSNLIGFFSRVTYNYKQKYLLTANLRYEASSKLVGTKHPWGTFPAISAGWRINKEKFMENVTFFNDLKLRVGYGVTGTAPDESFLGLSLLGYADPITGGSVAYLVNGQWIPGLIPISNPNPDLKWEVKKESNIGLDFAILKNRITGTIDYYNRRTNGLLYDYPVPSPPNLYGTTKANVGKMENKGLEVQVNYNAVQREKFSWTTSVNFSTNSNKLISLSNDLYQTTNNFINVGFTGSPVQTYTHRVEVGKPIGNFYGYKVVDINTDGSWVYEDKDGNRTNTKVEADKKILGNGLPKYYAGWNNNFRYGNFDLGITMRGAFGFQILNFQRMYSEVPGFKLYNQLVSAYDKVYGKAVLNDNILPEYNSHYVENGDFWKIDNITLGYKLNLNNQHFKSARVYFSSLNTFTITGYKGMDPEVNRLGLAPGNDDRDKYPSIRTFTVGFNVSIN